MPSESEFKHVETVEELLKMAPGLKEDVDWFETNVQKAKDGVRAVGEYAEREKWDTDTTKQVLLSLINFGFEGADVVIPDKDSPGMAYVKWYNSQVPVDVLVTEQGKMPREIRDKADLLNRFVEEGLKMNLYGTDVGDAIYASALAKLVYPGYGILVVNKNSSDRDLMAQYFGEGPFSGKVVKSTRSI